MMVLCDTTWLLMSAGGCYTTKPVATIPAAGHMLFAVGQKLMCATKLQPCQVDDDARVLLLLKQIVAGIGKPGSVSLSAAMHIAQGVRVRVVRLWVVHLRAVR